ncbi:MAG: tetratricopeptide repeat protein [Candidatus Muirbacterium halophilum]|nr:tetratricopeptide repeat protein [Candidatus Muirbacterium halophilum]MCK9476987.1 tetratricopeptide repeat protein [Candidatus Muirbacterium halophilum]
MRYRDFKWLFSIILLFFYILSFSETKSNFELGAQFLENGNIEQAEKIFLELYEKNQQDCMILNNLGVVFFMKKDYTKAYNYFEKAIKINPDYSNAYYNAGLVLFIRKMWPELSEFASVAIKRFPKQRKELELLISYSYYRLRRFQEGADIFINIKKDELSKEYWKLFDWVEKKYKILG